MEKVRQSVDQIKRNKDTLSMSSEAKMQNMFNLHYDVVSTEKNVVLPEICSNTSRKGASQYSMFSMADSL
jgi:hypothetical protein